MSETKEKRQHAIKVEQKYAFIEFRNANPADCIGDCYLCFYYAY